MKKRVVAILLSFTLCSAMVTEAGAAAIADPASTVSEDVFSDQPENVTEEQTQTGEAQIEMPENGESGNIVVEGAEDETDGSSDIITDDNVENNTEDVPSMDTVEPELDFGDDLFSSEDTLSDEELDQKTSALGVNNPIQAPAEFETENIEKHTATLMWSRWVYEDGKRWKLQKLPKTKSENVTSENNVQTTEAMENLNETVSTDDVVPEQIEENSVVDSKKTEETSEAMQEVELDSETDIIEKESSPIENVSTEEESVYVNEPVAYYTNTLVEVTTVDNMGNPLGTATYYFDKNGNMQTGIRTVNPGTEGFSYDTAAEYMFQYAGKAKRMNEVTAEYLTPYNSDMGHMQKDTDYIWDANAFHKYAEDGRAIDLKGTYRINGFWYFLKDGGKPFIGVTEATIDHKKSLYCFAKAKPGEKIPGKMTFRNWGCRKTNKGEQWLYFGGAGYYEKQGAGAYKLLAYYKNYTEYLVDADGYLVKNRAIKAANGYYYMGNGSGRIYKDSVVKWSKARYYFGKDGKRVNWTKRWIKVSNGIENGRYYYLGSSPGRVEEKKGIQNVKIYGKHIGWFLFDSNGNNVQNYWSDDRYYLPDGRMASGPVSVGKNKYFFELSSSTQYRGKKYKSKWIKYKNQYYHASMDGRLHGNGWHTINNGRYYFDGYTAVTNQIMQDPSTGNWGWLNPNSYGKHIYGWIAFNNSKNQARYLNPKTRELYKNKTKTINGVNYRFDKYGNRVNDRTREFRQSSYYVECDRVNGVMTVYTNSSKTTPIKTIRVSVGLPSTPTPVGTFTINRSDRWQLLMGPSWGQYGSHVVNGIFIHSVASGLMHGNNLPAGEYLKLGNPASHGCIRCCVADSKWVWENCNRSRIHIFDGKYTSNECFKGLLGRNPLTPLRGSGTFDPTDPDYN